MNKNIFLTAAALIAATPAFAQVPVAAPAPLTGPRIEALVGWDRVTVFGGHKDGVLYGVGAGYDFGISGSASLGVDVEASDSTTKISDLGDSVSTGRDLYAGVRASFLVSDRTSLYLKGGYTNARIKVTIGSISDAGNGDGFRVGGGAQYALSGKAYIGGEYRYSNYESDFARHQGALVVGTRF